MITVRDSIFSDIPSLLPLMEQLGYPATQEEAERRFKKFIAQEGYGVAVACDQDQLVGWIAWSRSPRFILDTTRFHIEGLVVDKKHRGQGVGKELMKFVEERAEMFKPALIDLTSGLRRASEGTHDFYKKLGYKNEGPLAKLYLRKEIK